MDRTRQTATQALLYIGAFFLTYTCASIERLLQSYTQKLAEAFLPFLSCPLSFYPLRYQKLGSSIRTNHGFGSFETLSAQERQHQVEVDRDVGFRCQDP